MARVFRLTPQEQEQPSAAEGITRRGAAWFPWWVAACLVILAWNTHRQLAIQHRLLHGSRGLEQIVGESRSVSSQTNQQLSNLRALDSATSGLDGKLAKVGKINAAIKADLLALESTASAIEASVRHMDGQVAESHALLAEIARQSGLLHTTLLDSRRVGEQVSTHLSRLVEAQEAVNADLAEMNRKTRFLDRFGGGNQP